MIFNGPNIFYQNLCYPYSAIIPFGWGQEGDSSYHVDEDMNHHSGIEISDRATLKGSAAAVKALNSVSPTSDQSYYNNLQQNPLAREDDNPHEIMAIEMTKTGQTADDATVALVENDISSDIFDESLRYSALNRPKLNIQYADDDIPSQNKQIRGDFLTEEERIANLFSPQRKDK